MQAFLYNMVLFPKITPPPPPHTHTHSLAHPTSAATGHPARQQPLVHGSAICAHPASFSCLSRTIRHLLICSSSCPFDPSWVQGEPNSTQAQAPHGIIPRSVNFGGCSQLHMGYTKGHVWTCHLCSTPTCLHTAISAHDSTVTPRWKCAAMESSGMNLPTGPTRMRPQPPSPYPSPCWSQTP